MANTEKVTPSTLPRRSALLQTFEQLLRKRAVRQCRRQLTIAAPGSCDFSSNDFLSLSSSPLFRSKFLAYLNGGRRFDASEDASGKAAKHPQGLASTGSRLLDGNSTFAEDLERFIASFHDVDSALLFTSGFDANVGVFSTVPQPGDIIVYDELIHASVHDGMRLSRASSSIPFPHNSPDGLHRLLSTLLERDGELKGGRRNLFVAVESVYSMDGDIAPVDRFADVLDALFPHQNAYLIIDEAHATGVFGPHGSGIVQSLGQQRRVFIRVHTFGKALASNGAVVLCDSSTRDYLVNYARTLIYTTAMSFPALASIRTAYELLGSEECDHLRQRLNSLIEYCHQSLSGLDPSMATTSMTKSTGESHFEATRALNIRHETSSPIFSLITPSAPDLATFCRGKGFTVRAVMPPTVPEGTERVRVCLHAGNTYEQVDGLTAAVKSWVCGTDWTGSRL